MSTLPFKFPPADDLPEQKELPDPFLGPNGKRVQSLEEWSAHREYLKAMLLHYKYGHMPPRPAADEVAIRQVMVKSAFDGQAIEEHLVLTIKREGKAFDLDLWLFRPRTERRYLTIVKNCHVLFDAETGYGDWAANIVEPGAPKTIGNDTHAAREAVERGYLLCKFNREQLAFDAGYKRRRQLADLALPPHRDVGIFPLYPDYDWGAMAVWAWTHGVVLDALDRLGYTDMKRTVVTGHSRGGQVATTAGIFDERIAAVVTSGAADLLRIRDPKGVRPKGEHIAAVKARAPYFYHPRFFSFADQKYRLPFDGHTSLSLLAPRPFLNTNATEDQYCNSLAVEAGVRTGQLVYAWMGHKEWCRLHWRPGTHAQQAEDWRALFDYSDEYFFGKKGGSVFNQWVYPDYIPRHSWKAPTL